MPNVVKKIPTQESAQKATTGMSKPSSSPAKTKVVSRKSVQKPELKEIPQRDLDISPATAEELKGEGFKFPSFQDITDWAAKEWYMAGNNPYIQMWTEETDPEKKKQLYKQAVVYQHEMEKNAEDAVKDYNKNEQSSVLGWLGENLDAFDLATSPVSLGVLGPVKIAKMGPLARTVGEAGLQAGLEGLHSGLEDESIAGGAVAGGLSGLVPVVPAFKANKNQAARREILEQAEELFQQDKDVATAVKGRLNRMKDGPLMTEAENKAYVSRRIPESGAYEYVPADVIDETGRRLPGEETFINETITDVGNELTGKYPRGQLKSLKPTQSTGEPPLLSTILDEIPERLDHQGNPAFYWSDVVKGINNWTPKNEPERILKGRLLKEYITDGNKLLPREKLLEEYPGLGLSALQPLYNATADISREGLKDAGEGAREQYEGIKGVYGFGKNLAEDRDLKEGIRFLRDFAKE